ncbi:hypothetical protein ABBQ32_003305 [Trebouxia sp. C0010 RCD-2024]
MRPCNFPQPITPSPCCGRVVHRPLRPPVTSTVCQIVAVHSDILISTYTNDASELMRAATYSRLASEPDPSNQPVDLGTSTSSGRAAGQAEVIQFPKRSESAAGPRKEPPLVRVRLSVNYRVHSRQLLCIGGSQIPFGWSFLSIAKVPMVWNQGDIWTAEVELPANTKIEYKYVILEEQDWTKQENEDAEGVVSFSYRTKPEEPPDVQTIQKQMAIVAWQPGPNRIVQVPSQVEIEALQPGVVQKREPAKPQKQTYYARRYGQQAFGPNSRLIGSLQDMSKEEEKRLEEELKGTYENISLDANGQALVERRDVWGGSGSSLGLRFG